jgi:hypothetical protein
MAIAHAMRAVVRMQDINKTRLETPMGARVAPG